MKRHEQLQNLSREHHLALKLALLARRALESGEARKIQAAATACATAFVSDLEPHFVREESDVLPLLAQAGQAALVERTLSEHDEMRGLAAQLDLPAVAPATLQHFGELLGAHVRFEEQELFEVAQRYLKPDDEAND